MSHHPRILSWADHPIADLAALTTWWHEQTVGGQMLQTYMREGRIVRDPVWLSVEQLNELDDQFEEALETLNRLTSGGMP